MISMPKSTVLSFGHAWVFLHPKTVCSNLAPAVVSDSDLVRRCQVAGRAPCSAWKLKLSGSSTTLG